MDCYYLMKNIELHLYVYYYSYIYSICSLINLFFQEISELERELARKNQLIAKATDKLKQWDNIFTENDDSDESELDEEFDDEMKD